MKITKIINITLLTAVFFAGCSKEEPVDGRATGYIKLFATEMTHEGGTKVVMDPSVLNTDTWKPGEQMDLGGTPYEIVERGTGFYLNVGEEPSGDLYAIYPATVQDALGNDIVVVNGSDGLCAIDIRSLAVNIVTSSSKLQGGYREEVYFPMAAHDVSSTSGLLFDHLTGGLKLTVSCSTAVSIDRLVVSAEDGSHLPAIYKNIAPTWAGGLLPAIPSGHGDEEDQSVEFVSTMTLHMNTNGVAGIEIQPSSPLVFCIPMLAKGLQYLTITGYNGDTEVFCRTKNLGTEKDIEKNTMYTIPEIVL